MPVPVIEWLEHVDKGVFSFVQTKLSAKWLDGIMLLTRNPLTWIPLYIFILFRVLKWERTIALKFICLSILCFAITDYSTAHFFKPLFERLRPCYDSETQGIVRGIIGCGGKYSFPSSHASNHFGLAAFWFYSLYLITNRKWRWLWLWAGLISYAQVYVGVHFPLDVLGGALLGTIIGVSLSKVFRVWSGSSLVKLSDHSSLSLH
jgi:membrane-associated phospholipid phosphatase